MNAAERAILRRRLHRGPTAVLREQSNNRKLSPVTLEVAGTKRRPRARRPFCSSTYASIASTCPDVCSFKGQGCMTTSGFTGALASALDRSAAGARELDVLTEEALAIDRGFGGGPVPQDGARGGRDLRLHVGGDVQTDAGARLLAAAAWNWAARGGGTAWTFTHSWRVVDRRSFGTISVLASVEHPADLRRAQLRGYAPAIVLPDLPRDGRRMRVPGSPVAVIPCPAETRGATCVECRLCLDHDLLGRGLGIAFGVHGRTADLARAALVQIRRPSTRLPVGAAPQT